MIMEYLELKEAAAHLKLSLEVIKGYLKNLNNWMADTKFGVFK